jgi:hypothetical protein
VGIRSDSLQQAESVGSGTFGQTLPIVNLPGRGPDLNLNLFYNARLWLKTSNNFMLFDYNHDWPAPAWSLGFGRIARRRWRILGAVMGFPPGLYDADGSEHRHSTEKVSNYTFRSRITDGTFIDYSSLVGSLDTLDLMSAQA